MFAFIPRTMYKTSKNTLSCVQGWYKKANIKCNIQLVPNWVCFNISEHQRVSK